MNDLRTLYFCIAHILNQSRDTWKVEVGNAYAYEYQHLVHEVFVRYCPCLRHSAQRLWWNSWVERCLHHGRTGHIYTRGRALTPMALQLQWLVIRMQKQTCNKKGSPVVGTRLHLIRSHKCAGRPSLHSSSAWPRCGESYTSRNSCWLQLSSESFFS